MSSFARDLRRTTGKYATTAVVSAPIAVFYALYSSQGAEWINRPLTILSLLVLAIGCSEGCWRFLNRRAESPAVELQRLTRPNAVLRVANRQVNPFRVLAVPAWLPDSADTVTQVQIHHARILATGGLTVTGVVVTATGASQRVVFTMKYNDEPVTTTASLNYIAPRLQLSHAIPSS